MRKWINNLASVHHLTSASPLSRLQNVRTHGSEFVWKFSRQVVFYKSKCLREQLRAHVSGPFCAYATAVAPAAVRLYALCVPSATREEKKRERENARLGKGRGQSGEKTVFKPLGRGVRD